MSICAVILAAGRGSRMGNLTEDRPKCLLELAGAPLLTWQTNALRQAGIEDILVVRGYSAQEIQGDFDTVDNPDWMTSNMVRTLLCASGMLQTRPCIIAYSDILYHPDHVRNLVASAGDIALTYDKDWLGLWRSRFADPLSDAETFREKNGALLEIGGRTTSLEDIQGQYMGLIKTIPQGFDTLTKYLDALPPDQVDRLDMTAFLAGLLKAGTAIEAVPVAGRWCECDSLSDLEQYQQCLARASALGQRWSHDWREEVQE